MEELKVEQTGVAADEAAEAGRKTGDDGTSVSYGKFKDAAALYKAYESLQAEFTKRCQRLKELETASAADKAIAPTEGESAKLRGITDKEKEDILKDYLKSVLEAKTKAIVIDGAGTGVKTPPSRPVTINEAGKLAKEFFD